MTKDANPVAVEHLDPTQKEAYDSVRAKVCALLLENAKVGKRGSADKEWDFCRLDTARNHQTFLLSGARGTGKTTVLLTLLSTWQEEWQGKTEDKNAPLLLPVGILDLQPLNKHTSLLLHIVGKFSEVVRRLEEREAEERKDEVHSCEELQSRKKWRIFVKAVAAAWDEGVQTRRAQLDVDSYAEELEYVESQRLQVQRAFSTFIDALANDVATSAKQHKRPISFLVAIDDADMNPSRCFELLQLVRSLYHPKVIFLMTGDVELFLHTVRAQIKSGLPDGKATQLAHDILNKVIPVASREYLTALPANIRYEQVKSALKGMKVNGQEATELFDATPQYADIFPDTWRELVGFIALLKSKKIESWQEMQTWLWTQAVERTTFSKELADVLRLRNGGGGLEIDLGELQLEYREVPLAKHLPTGLLLNKIEAVTLTIETPNVVQKKLSNRLASILSVASDFWGIDWSQVAILPPRFLLVSHTSIDIDIGWPFPSKISYRRTLEFSAKWKFQMDEFARLSPEETAEKVATCYITLVLKIGFPALGENWQWNWDNNPELWDAISGVENQYTKSVRSWLFKRLPLLAFPEYGLPQDLSHRLAQQVDTYPTENGQSKLPEARRAAIRKELLSYDDDLDIDSILRKFNRISEDKQVPTLYQPDAARIQHLLSSYGWLSFLPRLKGLDLNAFGEPTTIQRLLKSSTRKKLLVDSGFEQVQDWLEVADQFKEAIEQPLRPAIRAMWKYASDQSPSQHHLEEGENGLVLSKCTTTLELLSPPRPISLRDYRRGILEVSTCATKINPDFSSPLTELTFRIALDFALLSDGTNDNYKAEKEFIGARYILKGVETCWQSPEWVTPGDEEEMISLWNALVESTRLLGIRSKSNTADSLAYAFIQGCNDIFIKGTASSTKLSSNTTAQGWEHLISSLGGGFLQTQNHSARLFAFQTWVGSIAMYATPEFGLTTSTCYSIMMASTPNQRKKARDQRKTRGLSDDTFDLGHPFLLAEEAYTQSDPS